MVSKFALKPLKWEASSTYRNGFSTEVFGTIYDVVKCRHTGSWGTTIVQHELVHEIKGTLDYCMLQVEAFAYQQHDAWSGAFIDNKGRVEIDQDLWHEPDYNPFRIIRVFDESFAIYNRSKTGYQTEIRNEIIKGTYTEVKSAVEDHLIKRFLNSVHHTHESE